MYCKNYGRDEILEKYVDVSFEEFKAIRNKQVWFLILQMRCYMGKHFFDYEDGDFVHSSSDNMAMDIDSGELHIISDWSNDEDDD